MKRLKKLKQRYTKVDYGTISVIMNKNLEELEDLTKLIKKLRANSIQFQPLLGNNLKMYKREESNLWIPKERLNVLDETMDKLILLKKYWVMIPLSLV